MKNALSAAAVSLLLAVSALAQNATPNFSGTWNIDLAKSDFGPAPPPESMVMVVAHKEPSVKITIVQKGQQGESTNESVVTTDGKENVNKLRLMGGEQDVKSTTKWNGQKLATSRTLDIQGMVLGIDETWELSANATVITVVQDINTPQGAFAITSVFNKKP